MHRRSPLVIMAVTLFLAWLAWRGGFPDIGGRGALVADMANGLVAWLSPAGAAAAILAAGLMLAASAWRLRGRW